ncbi:phycobilisome rod-core linker polypeptide [Geminocystis sp. NIES-3709]|uniref:phycobilisome rod-core linker polypeptide n=1 Tax=Geminocystis sp. NIES-3709 TaxID=1617448 RepID=UPI0005FC895C|nr:phycobilisome rod-core linker polypeptide [Geminocystis sp. NIES-3709]BAQ66150.1 phycobilisome phycoerythrin-associated linker polypeptide [Geminocystis sp. NIES-3709]
MALLLDTPLELHTLSGDEVQNVIRAVYRQVLGNPHVMESERLTSAESRFCNGELTVRNFIREVAKSEFYRRRYFESCAPYRFVELNFKHLLGRAPQDQSELSEHIQITIEQGYDAEIDSYLDSDEYQSKFGENIVPYYQGASTQNGQKQSEYNRILNVWGGYASVDSAVKSSRLVEAIATNGDNKITLPSSGGHSGYKDATEKQFKIVVKGSKFDAPRRVSNTVYVVSGGKMTPQIQRIHRAGGTIVSITEVA